MNGLCLVLLKEQVTSARIAAKKSECVESIELLKGAQLRAVSKGFQVVDTGRHDREERRSFA